MTNLRSYGDPCGIARALDLVGERWALLIVRELVLGPKRFTDLKSGLPEASPNVLSQRLKELEAGGVVRRAGDGAMAYELTEWGAELHPLLVKLGHWGARSSAPPKGALGPDALVVALESTFQPKAAKGLHADIDLRLGDIRYSIHIENGEIAVLRGTPPKPDVVIETDAPTLRGIVFGDRALAETSAIAMRGDSRIGRAFLRLFARPVRV